MLVRKVVVVLLFSLASCSQYVEVVMLFYLVIFPFRK